MIIVIRIAITFMCDSYGYMIVMYDDDDDDGAE
jgi:hypothetical protein